MKKYISIVAMALVSLLLLSTISWGVSLFTSPIQFFTVVGVLTCGAACYWLVFGTVKRTNSGVENIKEKRKERKRVKQENRLLKAAKKELKKKEKST